MIEFKSQQVKSAIKEQLKRKAFTYEDLADHLGVSVPTVKRILGPEEISLNRIFEICEFLGLEFDELAKLAHFSDAHDEKFTPEQEKFLAKHPMHFAYFMKLCEGRTPLQIAEEFALSPRSTDKYLIALEKIGAIRVTGRQRVKSVFRRTPKLGRGELARAYFERFIQSAARFFIAAVHQGLSRPAQDRQDPAGVTIHGGRMSRASYLRWQSEIERLTRSIAETSTLEDKTLPDSELKTAVFFIANAYVEDSNPYLKPLNGVFGEIANL